MNSMKAAVLIEHNRPLEIIELPRPVPSYGRVLVKMAASGVCRAQILEISGTNATGSHLPHLLGHEGSGIVEEVGDGVTKVKPGDPVVLSWIKGSGANVLPTPYEHHGRKINLGYVTTFNEYALASENRVTPIPREMPLKEAALVGCCVATGMGIVFNTAKVFPGSSVLVVGAGGIGLSAIHAAAFLKASPLIAVDVDDGKLRKAREIGATHAIHGLQGNPTEVVRQLTGGKGVDYAFEAVGMKATMELVYESVNRMTGVAVLCGVPLPGQKIEIDPFPLYYGRRLLGTGGGESTPDRDFEKYCRLYLAGHLRLGELISHVIPFEKINDAIGLMRTGACHRVVITF